MRTWLRYFAAFCALFFLIVSSPLLGGTETIAEIEIDSLIYDLDQYFSANSNLFIITNSGSFGRDYTRKFGRLPGWYYPYNGDTLAVQYGSDTGTIIYDAGLVLSGKVNGEIRTALSIRDIPEFVPGPYPVDSTFPDLSYFEIYKIDTLSAPGDFDYDNWLIPYGAPSDIYGNPQLIGEQTLWAIFNDGDTAAHINPTGGGTLPLGVEVHQTVYGSTQIGDENLIYMDYKFFNRSNDTIDSFYISFFIDPDIGGPNDDLIGSDSAHNLFFAYNSSDYDEYFGFQIPAWGGQLISGPVVPSSGDTATFNHAPLPDYKNLPISSILGFGGGIEPISPEEIFLSASGLDCKTGLPVFNPLIDEPTSFYAGGNPVRRTGWVDSVSGDKKIMINFGPLTFNPGDSQQVSIKMGAYIEDDRLLSLSYLRNILDPSIPIDSSIDSTDYQPIDSVQLIINDFGLHNIRFDPVKERWLTGYEWGGRFFFGSADYASELFGSGLDTINFPDSFHNVEIRFSNIEKQYGYCYLRGVDTIYSYGGYYEVPFTVWDIDNHRQLNVAFVEDTSSNVFDSTWSPDIAANKGGYEFLFIFNSDYSGIDPYNSPIPYPDYNIVGNVDSLDILYVIWPAIRDGYTSLPIQVGQKLIIEGQFINHDGSTNQILFRTIDPGQTIYQNLILKSFAPGPSLVALSSSNPDVFIPSTKSIKYNGYDEVNIAVTFKPLFDIPYNEYLQITDSTTGELIKTVALSTYLKPLDIEDNDDDDNLLPSNFILHQNYPNPFNPTTVIEYSLTRREPVRLDIYNLLGQKVISLIDEELPAGDHRIEWNGTDSDNRSVASGIYFYRLEIGNRSVARKMVLLK